MSRLRILLASACWLLAFQACSDDYSGENPAGGMGGRWLEGEAGAHTGGAGELSHGGATPSVGGRAQGGAPSAAGSGGEETMLSSGGTQAAEAGASGSGTAGALLAGAGGSSGAGGTFIGGAPGSGAGGAEAGAGSSGEAGAGGAPLACEDFILPADCVDEGALPKELRCTGLYGNWSTRTLACGVKSYAPAYELWSDGALKRRFVALPPNTQIDVSDPDNWTYRVGTQFWKEFWVGGEQPRLGETRLLRKTELGWVYTTYVWSEDGTKAEQTNDGVANLFGTGHTVPKRDQCEGCHSGRPDFVLGWDVLMLGEGARGVTLAELRAHDLLAGTLPSKSIPGDAIERAALGYLHANCGVVCHNETEEAPGKSSGLYLRLELATLDSVHTTAAVTTGVNSTPGSHVALPPGGPYLDFRPLDPTRSLVFERMSRRDEFGMPRIGTNFVDPAGLAIVRAWIEHMTPERGYPAAAP